MMEITFTCITCKVKFANGDLQRDHYKSEWHRYNLKRKEADLPPITFKLFEEKKEQFTVQKKQEIINSTTQVNTYCAACGKLFKSINSYNTHISSKRHKENEIKFKEKQQDTESAIVYTVSKKNKAIGVTKTNDVHMNEIQKDKEDMIISDEDNENSEEVNDDDDINEEDAIPTTSCLFCTNKYKTFDDNWNHMKTVHGFFFPDSRFVSDNEAFVEFLGYKIGCGRFCIYCPETRSRFPTIESCRQHMVDKGHCKIDIDGDKIIEYYDFYDYSPLFDENDEEYINQDNPMIDEGYSLILPSGIAVGHRSLQKYYRQNLRHSNELVVYSGNHDNIKKFSNMKAIGTGEPTTPEIKSRARDMKFLRKLKEKYIMQLGIKSNKLFKSKGAQGQARN
ncbi:Zinc finger protein 622 [Strongyloides ratti]|uniref:Zinc finger protein 622 n=1 Tax=Strongyloides ratti TaxID=34506 RepID=A0A090L2Y9_STRRB|nr:Zinc finger protein 622 [Strongyloides ratti]CEF64072.1 Zinc finger protein 622 [Strongyloides ratti]